MAPKKGSVVKAEAAVTSIQNKKKNAASKQLPRRELVHVGSSATDPPLALVSATRKHRAKVGTAVIKTKSSFWPRVIESQKRSCGWGMVVMVVSRMFKH